MNKIILVFSILVCFSLHILAQDTLVVSKRTIIKVSPQHFFVNTFQLGFERFQPNFKHSFNFNLGITTANNYNVKEDGIAAEVQLRYYVSDIKAYINRRENSYLQGIYMSAFLRGEYFDRKVRINSIYNPNFGYSTVYGDQTIYTINPGITLGLQRTLLEVVNIDIYVGGGLRYPNSNGAQSDNSTYSSSDILDRDFQGIMPKIGFNIGIGF